MAAKILGNTLIEATVKFMLKGCIILIYILFFSLILLAFLSYLLNRGDILSPWVLSCCMFIISTFVVILNSDTWDSIGPKTVLVIVSALVAFGLGECIIQYLYEINQPNYLKKKDEAADGESAPVVIPIFVILIVGAFSAFVILLSYQKAYSLAVMAGYSGKGYMLNYTRYAMRNLDTPSYPLAALGQFIVQAIAYVFALAFVHNVIHFKMKSRFLLYLIPMAAYFILGILTTGRSWLIYLICTFLFCSIFIWRNKYGWSQKASGKIMVMGAICILCFYFLFFQMGKLTGKSFLMNINELLSLYTGSAIVTFDKFLTNTQVSSTVFGKETLIGIYQVLERLGFDVPHLSWIALPFAPFRGSAGISPSGCLGNTYTALRRYFSDYGYWGMLLIQFLAGAAFSAGYMHIEKKEKTSFFLLFYSYMGYALVGQINDDGLFTTLFSAPSVLTILFMFLVYTLVFSTYKKKKPTKKPPSKYIKISHSILGEKLNANKV